MPVPAWVVSSCSVMWQAWLPCYPCGMNSPASVLDRFLDRFTECLTPEVARRVADLRPDAATQARIDELREKANEGKLSEAERAEYEEFVESIDIIGILKAKARAFLAKYMS